MAAGAGVCDPSTRAAREALLSALLCERFERPPWTPVTDAATIAHRRRILLGKDRVDG